MPRLAKAKAAPRKSEGRGNWKTMPGNAFTLNQHIVFQPNGLNEFDIPALDGYASPHFSSGWDYASAESYADGVPIIPKRLISHKEMSKYTDDELAESFIHFWTPDYTFEHLWRTPSYCEKFKKCAGMLGFDFSIYTDQPKAVNIYNIYRSRWLSRYCERDLGIDVIPSVCWCDGTYDFCFEGIDEHSAVAISTTGAYRKEYRADFISGFVKMITKLSPRVLLVYGEYMPLKFEDYCGDVVYYETEWAQKRRTLKSGKGKIGE